MTPRVQPGAKLPRAMVKRVIPSRRRVLALARCTARPRISRIATRRALETSLERWMVRVIRRATGSRRLRVCHRLEQEAAGGLRLERGRCGGMLEAYAAVSRATAICPALRTLRRHHLSLRGLIYLAAGIRLPASIGRHGDFLARVTHASLKTNWRIRSPSSFLHLPDIDGRYAVAICALSGAPALPKFLGKISARFHRLSSPAALCGHQYLSAARYPVREIVSEIPEHEAPISWRID